ncbi:unnamed protein product [Phytophthora fragariaefolia]|uniref:Unnamed protein product n=1 Tax=Phytophthora fragariaefolia TaxID=1490495 RepID=A0A9W6U851_9STRA|nr:unnamed protein product [Phytophthora fragariaefolia]
MQMPFCSGARAPASFPDEFYYFNTTIFVAWGCYTSRSPHSQACSKIEKSVIDIFGLPTMVVLYIMWYKNFGMYKAMGFVLPEDEAGMAIVDPNASFIPQHVCDE